MSSISGSSPILPWHQWLILRETHLKRHCMLKATVLVYAKKNLFCIPKTYFFNFTLIFLQNTLISFSIIYIYSNKIFIYLTLWIVTVRVRWEKKWEKESEVSEEMNIKIIYSVNSNRVYMHGYCSFARPLCIFRQFYKDWCGGFWVKICKIEHFLYFRRLSTNWCGCSYIAFWTIETREFIYKTNIKT